jgi:tetratricopeptide (TPR) repeat protein
VHYYVYVDDGEQKLRALGQSEALAQSVCKRKSGDSMSCLNCYDPHSTPDGEDRLSYFREKCLACHGEAIGAKHYAKQMGCTMCHMPRSSSADVAHPQATDHRILRVPPMPVEKVGSSAALHRVRFPPAPKEEDDTPDLALAWESLAQDGVEAAAPQAERLLRKAVAEWPNDVEVLCGYGFIEQQHGSNGKARELYERALKIDRTSSDAETNLGVIEAKEGHIERAAHLWQDAFSREPGRSVIGMNLAELYCSGAQCDKARDFTERVLQFNPDLPEAKALLRQLNGSVPKCSGR